jgi:hypothetical protein
MDIGLIIFAALMVIVAFVPMKWTTLWLMLTGTTAILVSKDALANHTEEATLLALAFWSVFISSALNTYATRKDSL